MSDNIPITTQIAAVEREMKMRERAYPRWVADGRMTQAKADAEVAAMRAVLMTLRALPEAEAAARNRGNVRAVRLRERRRAQGALI